MFFIIIYCTPISRLDRASANIQCMYHLLVFIITILKVFFINVNFELVNHKA
jgi:hypothetical protein